MDKIDNSLLDTFGRLLSLDFYRGLTMFLLIAEGAALWFAINDPYFEGSIISSIGDQFRHHPWNGLRFWDLVQPFFMFIVGVAIPKFKNNLTRIYTMNRQSEQKQYKRTI